MITRIGRRKYQIYAMDIESHNDEESIAKKETSMWLGCFIDENSKVEDESSSEVAHKEQDKKPIINDKIKESINSNNSSNESFEINNYVDFDVPENTINKEYKLIIKNYNGVKIHVIQKIYTLKNGKIHIIECEYKPNKLNKI